MLTLASRAWCPGQSRSRGGRMCLILQSRRGSAGQQDNAREMGENWYFVTFWPVWSVGFPAIKRISCLQSGYLHTLSKILNKILKRALWAFLLPAVKFPDFWEILWCEMYGVEEWSLQLVLVLEITVQLSGTVQISAGLQILFTLTELTKRGWWMWHLIIGYYIVLWLAAERHQSLPTCRYN